MSTVPISTFRVSLGSLVGGLWVNETEHFGGLGGFLSVGLFNYNVYVCSDTRKFFRDFQGFGLASYFLFF